MKFKNRIIRINLFAKILFYISFFHTYIHIYSWRDKISTYILCAPTVHKGKLALMFTTMIIHVEKLVLGPSASFLYVEYNEFIVYNLSFF